MNETEEAPIRPKFRRSGLGYTYDTDGFRLTLSRIKRGSEATTGYLYVESLIEGMPGPLVANRFNLDSLTTRKTQAAHLSGKTNGLAVNWVDILDRFCLRVSRAEHAVESITTVGDMEETARSTWLVNNIVLENQPTTLFAPGGTGKSYFGLSVLLSAMTGHEFIPGFKPIKKINGLYMDYETTRPDVDYRVKELCRGLGIPSVRVPYWRCTTSVGDMVEDVSRYVASEGIGLIILDSVEMAQASQRESGDANQAIIELYKGLRMLDCAVLLIDHVNAQEATKTQGNRKPYGSIYKINLARIAFEIRLGKRDGGQLSIGLYNVKRNDGPLLNPIGLQVTFENEMVRYSRADVKDDNILRDGLSPLDRTEAVLKRFGKMTVNQLAEELNLTASTVRSIFHDDGGQRFRKLDEHDGKAPFWGVRSKHDDPFGD